MYGSGAIDLRVGNLPVDTSSKKNECSSHSNYQLLVGPQ